MSGAVLFGPAGNSESFGKMGYKSTTDVPEYLVKLGLDVYEYQCGRGVKISEQTARKFGNICAQYDIGLSLHAPYYISLSSVEEEKRDRSIDYILQSARAASYMGAKRVVVHSGSCGKITRAQALLLAKDTLSRALEVLDQEGLSRITLCPETMGKINQLGDLGEVLELCKLDERLIPCIDFGHLNSRTKGQMNSKEAFAALLDQMENTIGIDRARVFHSHFSKMEYTDGGEKCHLTFEDTQYGPEFEPLCDLIVQRGYMPTIICESAGTQAEDARQMKQIYQQKCKNNGGNRI